MSPVLQARILDVVKGSAATVALFLSFMMVPVFGLLPGIFVPAPALYYALKQGWLTGFALVLAAAALLLVVADPAAVVVYLLQGGILALGMSAFLIRLKGGARSIVYAVAVNLVCMTAAAALFGFLTGADLHAKVIKGVESSISQTALLYQKAGVAGDELKALNESMHQAGALIVTIYPALITVALGILGVCNLLLLARVASRVRLPVYLGDFKKYRNPEPLVWLLIAAGFGTLTQQSLAHLAALNVLIVLGILYLVQGCAVIAHFFRSYKVPLLARVFICLVLVLQPFMALAVAALGIFDLWGDFRSPSKNQNL